MTQVQLEADIAKWLIQITFFIAVAFSIYYGVMFRWRETVTGRSVMMLSIAIVGSLLRSVLLLWHIDIVRIAPGNSGVSQFKDFDDVLSWISIVGVGFAGLAILSLLVQSIQLQIVQSETVRFHISRFRDNHKNDHRVKLPETPYTGGYGDPGT